MTVSLCLPWRALCAVAIVLAPPALAVQTDGGPRFATDTPGGVMSGEGSYLGLKAEVAGPAAERPASLGLYPVRVVDAPGAAPGGFSLRILDGATPRLESGRHVTFRSWGWEGRPRTARSRPPCAVFTWRATSFAVVLDVRGLARPLQVEARAEGAVAGGTVTVANPDGSTVALLAFSPAPGFTLAFSGTAAPVGNTASSDAAHGTYAASIRYALASDGTLGFLVGFTSAATPDAGDLLSGLTQAKQEPGTWLGPVVARWDAEFAAFAPSAETSPAWLDADRRAIATLLHGESHEAAELPSGPVAAKGQRNFYYLWDSALAVLGASEGPMPRAYGYLAGLARAQRQSGDEAGLLPHHWDAAGEAPPLGIPGASNAYSAPPLLPSVLRALYERSPRADADRQQLSSGPTTWRATALNWWTRRRDKDVDTLAEVQRRPGGRGGGLAALHRDVGETQGLRAAAGAGRRIPARG